MLNIKSKFNKILQDFNKFIFKESTNFYWSSSEKIIYYKQITSSDDILLLLHEIAHAELEHKNFNLDVDLIKIEAEAWQKASSLALVYDLAINDELVQDSLDTYRIWLHKRSLCPDCNQNGIQTNQNVYSCINCRRKWRVNNSLFCKLRRTRLPIRNLT